MKSQIKDKQLNIIIGTCESNEDVIRLSNMNKINIGLMRYKIEKLERKIKVIICYKCGKPNHTAENCRNQAKCIRCSSLEHTSNDCPAKDNREQYRCPNCPGKHPATYAGCPEFKRAIINKNSYSNRLKQNSNHNNSTETNQLSDKQYSNIISTTNNQFDNLNKRIEEIKTSFEETVNKRFETETKKINKTIRNVSIRIISLIIGMFKTLSTSSKNNQSERNQNT